MIIKCDLSVTGKIVFVRFSRFYAQPRRHEYVLYVKGCMTMYDLEGIVASFALTREVTWDNGIYTISDVSEEDARVFWRTLAEKGCMTDDL